ncbi:hypothetical protein SAY87_013349 [Trapa incisa]|uniref:Probable 6-phosphogluconolactonase n=1 Tax=Trapa incisa TaxID=236973 RepID=A0AAN7KH00_9MYRT|nr:hypothetical protein SAY87_013349 [Trapa incisa]
MAFSRVRHNDRGALRVYDGSDDLAINLAEYIAELSEASVRDHGVFSVALSGGSLISLMRKLCEAPYNMTVDWARWHIFWADERVVSKSHSDSNYKLAKDVLLSKVPVVPSHIHSINDTVSAEEAANDYEFVIRQLVRTRTICVSDIHDCPKFDLILLGMGSDGHVASLFPGHESLGESNEWVTFLTDAPKPPHERITFTLPHAMARNWNTPPGPYCTTREKSQETTFFYDRAVHWFDDMMSPNFTLVATGVWTSVLPPSISSGRYREHCQ